MLMGQKAGGHFDPRWFGLPIALSMFAWPGCGQSPSADERPTPPQEAHAVTDQGMTLDADARPARIVFVLLQAIRDDVQAGDNKDARQAAFKRQLAISAPDAIFARSRRQSLGRDEVVRRIAWHWAPTLAYYVDSFPKTWEEARNRLVESKALIGSSEKANKWTNVYLELEDPSGDENAPVVAHVQLTRDGGFWRIVQVGFLRGTRHLPAGLGAAQAVPTTGANPNKNS